MPMLTLYSVRSLWRIVMSKCLRYTQYCFCVLPMSVAVAPMLMLYSVQSWCRIVVSKCLCCTQYCLCDYLSWRSCSANAYAILSMVFVQNGDVKMLTLYSVWSMIVLYYQHSWSLNVYMMTSGTNAYAGVLSVILIQLQHNAYTILSSVFVTKVMPMLTQCLVQSLCTNGIKQLSPQYVLTLQKCDSNPLLQFFVTLCYQCQKRGTFSLSLSTSRSEVSGVSRPWPLRSRLLCPAHHQSTSQWRICLEHLGNDAGMNNSDANNSADAANVSKYITTLRPMQRVELSRPVNKTPAYAPSGWCGPRTSPKFNQFLSLHRRPFCAKSMIPNMSILKLDGIQQQ